jgi:2-polyprenyl-6-methoxyphenol hydroxylase-like FAD-dependent oxidoreductase
MAVAPKQKHAEIAGGGISGLALAAMLARSGWSVTVHERNTEIREVGSGLVVHQSSAVIFEQLGILTEIVEGATRFERSDVWDENGRVLVSRPIAENHRTFNPLRVAVITAVHGAAMRAGVEVLTNSRAVAARPEGVLVMEDGSERKADLVIAADGVHSAVRDSLPDIEVTKVELPSGCTRTVIPRGDYDKDDAFVEMWSGSRRLGICPTSATETYVYFACKQNDAKAVEITPVNANYWAEAYPGLPAEFVDRLDKGQAIRHAYMYVRCSDWSSGRVAVIGDALHALPPTLGQGVGLAVSNAYALFREVADSDDIPAALKAWEATARPVTDATQDWSMRYEFVSSRWPQWATRYRPILLKFTRSNYIQKKMSALDDRSNQWREEARAGK